MYSPRAIEIAQIEVNAKSFEQQQRLFNGHPGTVVLSVGFFDCRQEGGGCGYGIRTQAVAFHDPVFKDARTLLFGLDKVHILESSTDYRMPRMQYWINHLPYDACEHLLKKDFCAYFELSITSEGEKALRKVLRAQTRHESDRDKA